MKDVAQENYCSCSTQWNPEKELKGYLAHGTTRCSHPMWNPEKELKDEVPDRPRNEFPYVESGEGIESHKRRDERAGDRHHRVESGEGIESSGSVEAGINSYRPEVESGEGIERTLHTVPLLLPRCSLWNPEKELKARLIQRYDGCRRDCGIRRRN